MSGAAEIAGVVLARCKARNMMVATAESCTGGLVAAAITDLPGSSAALERGFVTYSNTAKVDLLGVGPNTLARFGAVSEETAREMAEGALARSKADVAVSVTGIAGPGGGTPDKPVGLVWFGLAGRAIPVRAVRRLWPGLGRDAVRAAAVVQALELLAEALSASSAEGV